MSTGVNWVGHQRGGGGCCDVVGGRGGRGGRRMWSAAGRDRLALPAASSEESDAGRCHASSPVL